MAPSNAVTVSQVIVLRSSRRCAADTASTIVSELISSTNELIEVSGMLYSCDGVGEPSWRPRYNM